MLTHFFRDCTGAFASEYALILAIFGAGIGFAVYQLGIEQSAAIVRAAENMVAFTSEAPGGNYGAPGSSGD